MVRRHGFYGFLTAFRLSVTLAACGGGGRRDRPY